MTKCAARKLQGTYVQLYSDWQVISCSTRVVYCSLSAVQFIVSHELRIPLATILNAFLHAMEVAALATIQLLH